MGNSVRRYPSYGYVLAHGRVPFGPQYLVASGREAKCTRLGYITRLSRPHTLDPTRALALAFLRSNHLTTTDSEEKNNQEIPDKLQVT
jgi:hypothetical protein